MAQPDPNVPQPQGSLADFFASVGITPDSLGVPGGATPGGFSPLDPTAILKQSLYGAAGMNWRQSLTTQPYVGLAPAWVRQNPQMLSLVQQHTVDPYLPTTDMGDWRVFVGKSDFKHHAGPSPQSKAYQLGDTQLPQDSGVKGDQTDSVQAVANQVYLWDETQVKDAIKKFQDAGYTSVNDFDSLKSAWGGLVARAGAKYSLSSGTQKFTPWDMLAFDKKSGLNGSGSGSSGTPSTVHSTTRSVAEITHGDAWNALRDTMSKMLGHDPSDEEVKDFLGRMNYLAAKNPTISSSTTTGIGTANQHTSSHTKGGFNASDVLENAYNDAQSNPDYAEYQSATQYFNTALSALGAIGG